MASTNIWATTTKEATVIAATAHQTSYLPCFDPPQWFDPAQRNHAHWLDNTGLVPSHTARVSCMLLTGSLPDRPELRLPALSSEHRATNDYNVSATRKESSSEPWDNLTYPVPHGPSSPVPPPRSTRSVSPSFMALDTNHGHPAALNLPSGCAINVTHATSIKEASDTVTCSVPSYATTSQLQPPKARRIHGVATALGDHQQCASPQLTTSTMSQSASLLHVLESPPDQTSRALPSAPAASQLVSYTAVNDYFTVVPSSTGLPTPTACYLNSTAMTPNSSSRSSSSRKPASDAAAGILPVAASSSLHGLPVAWSNMTATCIQSAPNAIAQNLAPTPIAPAGNNLSRTSSFYITRIDRAAADAVSKNNISVNATLETTTLLTCTNMAFHHYTSSVYTSTNTMPVMLPNTTFGLQNQTQQSVANTTGNFPVTCRFNALM